MEDTAEVTANLEMLTLEVLTLPIDDDCEAVETCNTITNSGPRLAPPSAFMTLHPQRIVLLDIYIELYNTKHLKGDFWRRFLGRGGGIFVGICQSSCFILEEGYILNSSNILNGIEDEFIKLVAKARKAAYDITLLTPFKKNPLVPLRIDVEMQKRLNGLKARDIKSILKKSILEGDLEITVAERYFNEQAEKRALEEKLKMRTKLETYDVIYGDDETIIFRKSSEERLQAKHDWNKCKSPFVRRLKRECYKQVELFENGYFDLTNFKKKWEEIREDSKNAGNKENPYRIGSELNGEYFIIIPEGYY